MQECIRRQTARVGVIRKVNGGKASALNRGLRAATGEIIVSLDADTLFRARHNSSDGAAFRQSEGRRGIGQCARWQRVRLCSKRGISSFARAENRGSGSGVCGEPMQGALLTRWQSLEYITSQNFDRRGYDLMNCITVVPGAVGALRRQRGSRCRGLHARYAGRRHRSDVETAAGGLAHRQRQCGDGLHGSAGKPPQSGEAAVSVGVWDAAMPVEAPGRAWSVTARSAGLPCRACGFTRFCFLPMSPFMDIAVVVVADCGQFPARRGILSADVRAWSLSRL